MTTVGLFLLLSQISQAPALWWTLQGGQTWQYSRIWVEGSPELWLFPSEQWVRQSQLEGQGGLRGVSWKARIREVHPSGDPPYIWMQLQRGHSQVTLGDLTEEDWDIEDVDPGRQQGIDVRYRDRTLESEFLTLFSSSIPYREFLRGQGSTGPYRLTHTPVIPGSERIIRWRNTQPETLVLHRDYELSPLVGEIILRGGPLFPEEMLEVYYRARGHGVGLYAFAQSWHPSSQRFQGGWIQVVDSSGRWQSLYFGQWENEALGFSLTDLRGHPDAFRIQGHGRWEGESSSLSLRAGWVDPGFTVAFTRNIARGGWFEGELQHRWRTFLQSYQGAYRRDAQWEHGTHTWTLQKDGPWVHGIAVLWDRAIEKTQQLKRETHALRWFVRHTGIETSLEWREGVDHWKDTTDQTQSWWTWHIHASGTGWEMELEQEWTRSRWQHTARFSLDRTSGSWNTGALLIFRRTFDGDPFLSLEGHLQGGIKGWFTTVQWNRDVLFQNTALSSGGFERLYMEGQHALREGELRLMYNREVGLRRVSTDAPFDYNQLETWSIFLTEGHSTKWRGFFHGAFTRTRDVDTALSSFSEHLMEGKGVYTLTRQHVIEMVGRWHARSSHLDTLPLWEAQRKIQIRGIQRLPGGQGSIGMILLDSTRQDTSFFSWWRTGLQLAASRQGKLTLEPALLMARNTISNIPHPFWSVRADIILTLYASMVFRLHLWDEVSGTEFHYRGAECSLGTTIRGINGQVRYWLQEDLMFQTYRAELHATLGIHF